jgi:hypothetical protein
VEGKQIAITRTAQFSQHLGLLGKGNLYYRCSRHSNSSLIVAMVSQLLIYQRVCSCANLPWFDLVVMIVKVLVLVLEIAVDLPMLAL